MGYHEHKRLEKENIGCAVLVTSDSRTEETDESGKLIKQRLLDKGHRVVYYTILKNDAQLLKNKILELVNRMKFRSLSPAAGQD